MAASFSLDELGPGLLPEVTGLLKGSPGIVPSRFDEGDLLVREGEKDKDFFLVLKGAFAVEQERGSAPGQPGTFLAGEECTLKKPIFVGEMACLGGGARSASVRAVGRVYALRLRPEHLDAIMDNCPGLTRILCQQFTQRLRETNRNLRAHEERLCLHATQTFFNPGQALTRQGDPAKALHQVIFGLLRKEEDGQLADPQSLPNGFIEAPAFFKGGVYSATWIAEGSAALVISVDQEHKAAAVRNYPELVLGLLS